ncbi:3-oxoacyl-[acyl-carrier-protein] reductase [Amorphoplanes nipponensis]|uniref:Beta-ketoacyl-ACP reductase n=1 Tax=Actinoplanes nipponensis TaxID=135950 RepID=A0A919JAB2_9ACTN|nr:glucose 1-dehydrogenase [Actinoplanes nipponensis]GIE47294.1 beta-ketoacyl-ACP reductase [Actinoplanes nipponensis]
MTPSAPAAPLRLDGRVALVTGGARNIGLAIARRLVAEGAAVAVNGPDATEAAAAAAELCGSGVAAGFPADVSQPDAVGAMVDAVIARFGRLDILVNNAATPMTGRVPLFDLDLDAWEQSFAVNARGVFLCSVAAARAMTRGGARATDAAIVNISSVGAVRAHRRAVAYDATKGAVEATTRAMALELAPLGVRVNAVAPGAIGNDRTAALSEADRRRRAEAVPLGRIGAAADVAAAVAFLASADAAYITGQVITVDGGLTAQARPPQAEL